MKKGLLVLFVLLSFSAFSQKTSSLDTDNKKNVNVYINYTTNSIVVYTNLSEIKDVNIDVFNITGNFVRRFKIREALKGEYYIPKDLQKGMYILKINYDKVVFTRRIIVKR